MGISTRTKHKQRRTMTFSLAKIFAQCLAMSAVAQAYNRKYWQQVYNARKAAMVSGDEVLMGIRIQLLSIRELQRSARSTISRLSRMQTTCSILWLIMTIFTRPTDSFIHLSREVNTTTAKTTAKILISLDCQRTLTSVQNRLTYQPTPPLLVKISFSFAVNDRAVADGV